MANFPLVNSICAKDRSSHPHLLPPSEPVGYETRSTSLVDGDFGTLAVSTRPCQLASWIFSINNITLVANISKVSWLSCKQQTSKPHTCTMLYIGPRHLGHLRGAALGSWQPVPAACRPIPTAFICFTGGEGLSALRMTYPESLLNVLEGFGSATHSFDAERLCQLALIKIDQNCG